MAKFTPKTTPQEMSEFAHDPEALQTFIGRIPAVQLIPAMPVPLSPMAAAIPATCVPCDGGGNVSVVQLVPAKTLPPKSGCVLSMAESTTATTVLGLPAVMSQADGALLGLGRH